MQQEHNRVDVSQQHIGEGGCRLWLAAITYMGNVMSPGALLDAEVPCKERVDELGHRLRISDDAPGDKCEHVA